MKPIKEKDREYIFHLLKDMKLELETKLDRINKIEMFVAGIENREIVKPKDLKNIKGKGK